MIIVQFCCSVMSYSLRPHGLKHARLPCPSPTPGACSNSCLLSQWSYPTISFSVIPISSCLQKFPESAPFSMSQFFASGDQNIEVSALASVLPIEYSGLVSIRTDWFDFLIVQGTLKSLLQHHSSKASRVKGKTFVALIRPFSCVNSTVSMSIGSLVKDFPQSLHS